MARKKISLIGAGNVGGTLALYLTQKELGDIILLDVADGIPQGKSLDILHCKSLFGTDVKISGTQDFSLTEQSDIYVVSAGSPRKPGMSRDDLLKINAGVIKDVGEKIKKYSPRAFVIVITNPLDAMTQLMKITTGFPKNRIMGMAGVLDSCRFKAFLAEELNVSIEDIHTMVLGGHGDNMVPLTRYCTVSGIPVSHFISQDKLKAIAERVKKAGGEIVGYLKTGSAFSSPAASACQMVEAIIKDKKRVLSCSAYLEGEYEIEGYYMGVPVILGADGVEDIIELDLTGEEKALLNKSYESCCANIETLRKLGFL
jgi:malate dehydrogenase